MDFRKLIYHETTCTGLRRIQNESAIDAVARKIHVIFTAKFSNGKLLNPNQSQENSDKL